MDPSVVELRLIRVPAIGGSGHGWAGVGPVDTTTGGGKDAPTNLGRHRPFRYVVPGVHHLMPSQPESGADLAAPGLELATVLISGAGQPLGRQLARRAARQRPARLVLVDPDGDRLSQLAQEVPGQPTLVVADPTDLVAMGETLARHRPDLMIHVAPSTDAMVEGSGTDWPATDSQDVTGLALLAAEYGCTRFLELSKTDLFDGGSSPSEPGDPVASDASLLAALENERANAEHLRRTMRQQRQQLRRKVVRAALAIDDRGGRVAHELFVRQQRLARRLAKVGLIVNALPSRPQLASRRVELATSMTAVGEAPALTRRVSIIIVTDQRLTQVPRLAPDLDVELVIAATGPRASAPPGVVAEIVPCESKTVTAAAASGAARAKGRLLCFMAATSEPVDDTWLARLAGTLGDGVLAATPMLVHPERPVSSATPHDLRVRELGLEVVASEEARPVAEARSAGGRARPGDPPIEVAAASSACLVVDRVAFDEAGGLAAIGDFDAAIVDLCGRLRAGGGKVMAVPSAVVLDHRPVRSRKALTRPIDPDSADWRTVVDRQGPTLLALARGDRVTEHLRIALTVAAPSLRVAPLWGDWHLAQALARSLRREGHSVHLQTSDLADDPAGRSCDLHVVFRGLTPVARTPGQRHVLWLISHPESLDTQECDEADLVLVASERLAADLRTRTTTPVEVMLQATDPRRFAPTDPDPRHTHAVAVVAMTRRVFRPSVAYALASGLRPAIYGRGWREFVDPALIVAEFIPNDELATVYSSIGVLLNDHWDTMRAWGIVSNRLFDGLACGTPIVSDHLPELDELFGPSVSTYTGPDELRLAVDEALEDPIAARRRAAEGREIVLAHHTFDNRARQLLDALARYGLDRPAR